MTAANPAAWHQRIAFGDGSVAARAAEGDAWRLLRPAPGQPVKSCQASLFAAHQNRLAKWPHPSRPIAASPPAP